MLAAGSLNRRIVISRAVPGQDAWGQALTTWETVATVWSHFLAPKGRAMAEEAAAGREISATPFSVRIRRRTGLDSGMRVTEGADVYTIAQVIHDVAGREYTDLVCVAGEVAP